MSVPQRLMPHLALLRLPWQQRRRQGPAWRGLWVPAGLAVTPLLAGFWLSLPVGHTLAALGLVWLTWLWWMQVDGLVRQNRPALARLLPGQAAALRLSLVLQAGVVVLVATLLLALVADDPLRWAWLVLPCVVGMAWLVREPWLWLVFGIVSPWLGSLRLFTAHMQAQPLVVQALAVAVLAALLALCVGQGGRLHRWVDARHLLGQRILRAAAEGRPTPPIVQGQVGRALLRCFDWPLRLWRDRVLAAGARAPLTARLDLGLDTGGRWVQLLWTGAVVASAVAAVLSWVMSAHGVTAEALLHGGRFGLGIGVYALIASLLQTRLSQLWARRREQALLALLPGVPAAGEVAMLERAWRREWLGVWAGASVVALGLASLGQAGTLTFVALCAGASLPLVWWAQWLQRRLQAAPRVFLLTLVPPAAAALALLLEPHGLPPVVSLGLGAALYAACAWWHGRAGRRVRQGRLLRWPVDRAAGSAGR